MRIQSYLLSATTVIKEYDGKIPLAAWLKAYFSAHKKFGSRDRKMVAQLCYCYYRLGHALPEISVEERLKIALFLCAGKPSEALAQINELWNENASKSLPEKLQILGLDDTVIKNIFPWYNALSIDIDPDAFAPSFLQQPLLYLRLRPGKEVKIKNILLEQKIPFDEPWPGCIALSNSTKADAIFEIDADVVIQDLNSQKVLSSLLPLLPEHKKINAWDCCAASGGKSLLLLDQHPKVQLLVSDVRPSILQNLRNRFLRAHVAGYSWKVADASMVRLANGESFDFVLCDAPCSGSGTWSRTPEQLHFFSEQRIEVYSELQKKIVVNASKYVAVGGYFLYITCSVFKQENEAVAESIKNSGKLQLINATYYKGYGQRADTLFTALFKRL